MALLREVPRIILCSGTPCQSKWIDIFCQAYKYIASFGGNVLVHMPQPEATINGCCQLLWLSLHLLCTIAPIAIHAIDRILRHDLKLLFTRLTC